MRVSKNEFEAGLLESITMMFHLLITLSSNKLSRRPVSFVVRSMARYENFILHFKQLFTVSEFSSQIGKTEIPRRNYRNSVVNRFRLSCVFVIAKPSYTRGLKY